MWPMRGLSRKRSPTSVFQKSGDGDRRVVVTLDPTLTSQDLLDATHEAIVYGDVITLASDLELPGRRLSFVVIDRTEAIDARTPTPIH